MSSYSQLTINTDGGSRGNPGPSAIGVVIRSDGQKIAELSEYLGTTTNNIAEYTAVLKALEYLKKNDITAEKICFVLDSELVVKQINGLYKVKIPHLQEISLRIKELIAKMRSDNQKLTVTFEHVLRENNKDADRLVNSCLDTQI